MELRDLDYFLACCEAGSFTAAARKMHIVQSAMSGAIARLEHDLGVPLFDRSVTPVAVTAHGAALRAGAQRILDAVQEARDDVAAVCGQIRGTVVLGTTLNTGPLDLAAVLADVRERHPGVVIHVRQSTARSEGNLRAVQEGSIDIALTASSAHPATGQPPPGVVLHPLASEALVFTCRSDHPLSRRPEVRVRDLADETILRFPPGWGVRDTVDRVLGDAPEATEIADYTLMTKLVQRGFGTALIPASAAAGLPDLRSVPVTDARLRWKLSAAINAGRPANRGNDRSAPCAHPGIQPRWPRTRRLTARSSSRSATRTAATEIGVCGSFTACSPPTAEPGRAHQETWDEH